MNPSETAALGERLEAVRAPRRAARIAGRKPEDVRLIAVSKLHPVEAILAAYGFGQRVFWRKLRAGSACQAGSPSRSRCGVALHRPRPDQQSQGRHRAFRPHPHCGQLEVRRNAGPPPARRHSGAARAPFRSTSATSRRKPASTSTICPPLPKPSLHSRALKSAA